MLVDSDFKKLQKKIKELGLKSSWLFYIFYIIDNLALRDEELLFRKSRTKPHDEESLLSLFYPATKENISFALHTLKSMGLITQDIDGFIKINSRGVKEKDDGIEGLVDEIIDFLNETCNKSFSKEADGNRSPIRARVREENGIDDIKNMIKFMNKEWGSDTRMNMYLRPTTLFAPTKFDAYMNSAPKVNTSLITVTDPTGKVKLINKKQFQSAETGYYKKIEDG